MKRFKRRCPALIPEKRGIYHSAILSPPRKCKDKTASDHLRIDRILRRPFIYLSFCTAVFLACGSPPPALDVDEAKQEILNVLFASQEGWNRGDVTRYMQAYWQSDSLRFASGGTVSKGWQAVLQRYQAHYPDQAAMGQLVFSQNVRYFQQMPPSSSANTSSSVPTTHRGACTRLSSANFLWGGELYTTTRVPLTRSKAGRTGCKKA